MKISNEIAILGAGAIIGASILGARLIGHYQLVVGVDSTGALFMMRIDTVGGTIENCRFVRDKSGMGIQCLAETPLRQN